jgi:hypothetical protein
VEWNDTTTIYAYSVPADSVRSDNLNRNYLGSAHDPDFGTTTAGIYTQFSLSAFDHDFGPNPQLDSLVIQLLYTGDSYGDTTTPLTIHAYQVEEDFYFDSVYYSNIDLTAGETDYSNYTFTPLPNDSVVVEGDTLPALLRIPLDFSTELGEYLLNASDEAMENTENFHDYFKGLYLVTDEMEQGGSLFTFDLVQNISRMTIFYSNDGEDSLRFEYLITSSMARLARYIHNFETGSPEFQQQVLQGDTLLGQQQFYLQGLGGVSSVIRFPHLEAWRDQNPVGLNEAKLVLTGLEEPANGAPPQLLLAQFKEDGNLELMPDYFEGEEYFNGFYNPSSNSYIFRITLYLQDFINDETKIDYGLSLFVNNPWARPENFILNGNQPVSDTAVRLKLELLYTKFD